MRDHATDIKTQIADRIQANPDAVWTPVDFLDLGSREAVDKTLQRLTLGSQLRRLDRGLYDGTVSRLGVLRPRSPVAGVDR